MREAHEVARRSTRMSPPRACSRTSSTQAERRTWFLFEASRGATRRTTSARFRRRVIAAVARHSVGLVGFRALQREPAGPAMTPSRDIDRLLEIMAALRTPGPAARGTWSRISRPSRPTRSKKPTRSRTPSRAAISTDLREELGDLLLQVVFHARMAQEQGAFDFGDVVRGDHRRSSSAGIRMCSASASGLDARRPSRACGTASRREEKARQGRQRTRRERGRARRRAGRRSLP